MLGLFEPIRTDKVENCTLVRDLCQHPVEPALAVRRHQRQPGSQVISVPNLAAHPGRGRRRVPEGNFVARDLRTGVDRPPDEARVRRRGRPDPRVLDQRPLAAAKQAVVAQRPVAILHRDQ